MHRTKLYLLVLSLGLLAQAGLSQSVEWPSYNGDLSATRFSPLNEITPSNVKTLRPACTYDTGETTAFQSGLLMVQGEPVVWIARTLHPALHEYLLESCQRLGYVPRIAHEVSTVSELFDLVAAGIGIGFVKRSTAEQAFARGVVFRELTGLKLFIDTGVAYRSDNQSEALQSLLQLLREQST